MCRLAQQGSLRAQELTEPPVRSPSVIIAVNQHTHIFYLTSQRTEIRESHIKDRIDKADIFSSSSQVCFGESDPSGSFKVNSSCQGNMSHTKIIKGFLCMQNGRELWPEQFIECSY